MGTCISRDNMMRFLAGETPPQQESEFAAHLSRCPHCHDLAEALSDLPLAGARIAEHGADTAYAVGNSLHELQGRLQALALYDASNEPQADPATSTVTGGYTWRSETTESETTESETAPPRRLGKFEIIRQLGAGGFSVVYLARDKSLDRLVALKLPRASILADPDSRRRFFREAQALARLDHPHIVSVYEAGEYEDTCYLAVEFCDGPTLDEWRRQQPGPVHPDVAARILLTLAGAVEHAHDHGIFHRDIKPANVLLSMTPDGADQLPEPRLADFGLARVIDGDVSQATLSGVVLGTPQYLAPEQAAGMTDRIGPQTDIYALGAVLYELVTGRPPILGATSIDTLRRVLVDDPAPMRDMVGGVPIALENVVAKCLEKSTEFRYSTARHLADDLRRFLNGQQVQTASPRRGDQWRRRRARAAIWLAAVAVGLIACLAGWFTLAARKPETNHHRSNDVALAGATGSSIEEQPQQQPPAVPSNATVEGCRIVPSWLAKAEGLSANGTPFPFNLPAQRMPSMRYQQIYSKSEFDSAGMITAIRFRRDEGEPAFSTSGIDARIHLSYARTSIDDFSSVFADNIGDNRTTVVDTQNLTLSSQGNGVPRPFDIIIPFTAPFHYDPARGDLLLEVFVRNAVSTAQLDFSGRVDQNKRVVTRRLFAPAAKAAAGTVDFVVSPYPAGLATRFDMVFDSPSAPPTSPDENPANGEPRPRWQTAMEAANEFMAAGKFDQAESLLREALHRSSDALGQRHSDAIEVESRLGECLARQRNLVEAERHLLDSHAYLLQLDRVAHVRIRSSCERLIQLYDAWGKTDELPKWHAQWARARRQEIAGWPAEPADKAVALQSLGFCLMKHHEAATAEEPLRQCFALRLKSLGPQHYGTVSAQHRLGECLASLKKYEEAEEHLLKSYEDLSHRFDLPTSWRASYCLRLVNLYRDWGKPEELERWKAQWRDDVRRESESLPASPAERSVALLRLGQMLLEYGEFEAAEPLLSECLEIRERATPNHWSTQHARSTLGASLLGQQKYQQAEPLLVVGFQGLAARRHEIDASNREAPAIALKRLIRLYEQWDRPAEAARWKKELN